jgi:hypothetical protein
VVWISNQDTAETVGYEFVTATGAPVRIRKVLSRYGLADLTAAA